MLFYQEARKLSKTTGEVSKGLRLTKDGTTWTSKRTISVKNKQTKGRENICKWCNQQELNFQDRRRSKDGGEVGWGNHFLPHKFIKRTFKRWVNSTKQLLNASRGHQAPRKAAHSLRKEVGKNIKDKKRDKSGRDRARPGKGVLKKREVSKHQETLSLPSLWQALEPQRTT